MDEHRLVDNNKVTAKSFDPPFSSFEYVESNYGKANPAIPRLFSLARSHDARTLMIEKIEPAGIILDENDEIKSLDPDHEMKALDRISFWRSSFIDPDERVCLEEDCIGYAILKHDTVPSKNYDTWRVFEAVFKKYDHPHNCVPNPTKYTVVLGGQRTSIEGVLYAQQNELNKACAQVALRSLISRIIKGDVSYRQINDLARKESQASFNPAEGLSAQQIGAVLKSFGIGFVEYDYTQATEKDRTNNPYQKFIYAGIESGMGALLGFHFTGKAIQGERRHIIPFFGHTFNKDTWAPEADIFYFRVGEQVGYIPSEYWTSSFLGHDDNFGPNFCVPRLYINPDNVEYVVELLKPGRKFSGAQAEAISLQLLYSVLPDLPQIIDEMDLSQNIWLNRLIDYARQAVPRIVFRAVAIDKDAYIKHLSNEKDWDGNVEGSLAIDLLRELPEALWVVEISTPQLFAANERKLGEIILNGETEIVADRSYLFHLHLIRLPGFYLSVMSGDKEFLTIPSNLKSHLRVIELY